MRLSFIEGKKSIFSRNKGVLYVMDRAHEAATRARMRRGPGPNGKICTDRIRVMMVRGLPNHPNGFVVQPVPENAELLRHRGFHRGQTGMLSALAMDSIAGRPVTRVVYAGTCHRLVVANSDTGEHGVPGRIYVEAGRNVGIGLPAVGDAVLRRHSDAVGQRAAEARASLAT